MSSACAVGSRSRSRALCPTPTTTSWCTTTAPIGTSPCSSAARAASSAWAMKPSSSPTPGRLDTEVRRLDVRPPGELRGRAAEDDRPLVHHVQPLGDTGRESEVLLDEQDREAAATK